MLKVARLSAYIFHWHPSKLVRWKKAKKMKVFLLKPNIICLASFLYCLKWINDCIRNDTAVLTTIETKKYNNYIYALLVILLLVLCFGLINSQTDRSKTKKPMVFARRRWRIRSLFLFADSDLEDSASSENKSGPEVCLSGLFSHSKKRKKETLSC